MLNDLKQFSGRNYLQESFDRLKEAKLGTISSEENLQTYQNLFVSTVKSREDKSNLRRFSLVNHNVQLVTSINTGKQSY